MSKNFELELDSYDPSDGFIFASTRIDERDRRIRKTYLVKEHGGDGIEPAHGGGVFMVTERVSGPETRNGDDS